MYLNLVTQVGAQKNNFGTEWLADGPIRGLISSIWCTEAKVIDEMTN